MASSSTLPRSLGDASVSLMEFSPENPVTAAAEFRTLLGLIPIHQSNETLFSVRHPVASGDVAAKPLDDASLKQLLSKQKWLSECDDRFDRSFAIGRSPALSGRLTSGSGNDPSGSTSSVITGRYQLGFGIWEDVQDDKGETSSLAVWDMQDSYYHHYTQSSPLYRYQVTGRTADLISLRVFRDTLTPGASIQSEWSVKVKPLVEFIPEPDKSGAKSDFAWPAPTIDNDRSIYFHQRIVPELMGRPVDQYLRNRGWRGNILVTKEDLDTAITEPFSLELVKPVETVESSSKVPEEPCIYYSTNAKSLLEQDAEFTKRHKRAPVYQFVPDGAWEETQVIRKLFDSVPSTTRLVTLTTALKDNLLTGNLIRETSGNGPTTAFEASRAFADDAADSSNAHAE